MGEMGKRIGNGDISLCACVLCHRLALSCSQGLLCRIVGAVGGQVCFATCVWAVLIPQTKGILSYSVLLKLCSWLSAGKRKGIIVVL